MMLPVMHFKQFSINQSSTAAFKLKYFTFFYVIFNQFVLHFFVYFIFLPIAFACRCLHNSQNRSLNVSVSTICSLSAFANAQKYVFLAKTSQILQNKMISSQRHSSFYCTGLEMRARARYGMMKAYSLFPSIYTFDIQADVLCCCPQSVKLNLMCVCVFSEVHQN